MRQTDTLIELALAEDLGPGDITTDALIEKDAMGSGEVVAKQSLVLAGLGVARKVFVKLDPAVEFSSRFSDGDFLEKGQVVFSVAGRLRALLVAERTALNFLQRLSGIATLTRSHVELAKGKNVRIVDTRKTTPGWRSLEKYAVGIGGGTNHRMGLFDGILIKDNHIAASGSITEAVRRARQKSHHLVKIEVEVTDLSEAREAIESGADVIMLDNMDLDRIREAVQLIDGRALVEVSGGVELSALPRLLDTGVDIISVGALTHSAPSVDMSMRIFGPGKK